MTCKRNGVGTRMKEKVNPFLTSVHCVVYKTNLTTVDTRKTYTYKDLSKKINTLLSLIATQRK